MSIASFDIKECCFTRFIFWRPFTLFWQTAYKCGHQHHAHTANTITRKSNQPTLFLQSRPLQGNRYVDSRYSSTCWAWQRYLRCYKHWWTPSLTQPCKRLKSFHLFLKRHRNTLVLNTFLRLVSKCSIEVSADLPTAPMPHKSIIRIFKKFLKLCFLEEPLFGWVPALGSLRFLCQSGRTVFLARWELVAHKRSTQARHNLVQQLSVTQMQPKS